MIEATVPETPRRRPWWLWPNVVCLDAPVVALVWLAIFAAAYGMAVPAATYAVLFLVVWSLYASDRVIDALKLRAGDPAPGLRSARHAFAGAHGKWMALLAFLAAAAGFAIAMTYLERPILGAGMIVAVAAAAYFGAFVAPLGGKRPLPGKEIASGMLIAAGVTVPVFADYAGVLPVVPAFSLFAGLCALNCLMLNARDGDLPLPGWLIAVLGIMLTVAAAVAASLDFIGGGETLPPLLPLYGCLVASAAILTVLQFCRRAPGRDAFRVLADAALLTPLFPLISWLARSLL